MPCNGTDRDFSFFVPIEIVKSASGDMRIGGIASDENADDIQGDKVFVAGLDTSYLSERGSFNWNHGKEAKDLLGEIDIVQKNVNKGTLYVEGFLYPKVEQAEAVYKLMKGIKESGSKRRLGLSIEGKIKERNGNEIKKAWLRAVALTADPINKGSFVDLIKSLGNFEFTPCQGDCDHCTFTSCEEGVDKSEEVKNASVEQRVSEGGIVKEGQSVGTKEVEKSAEVSKTTPQSGSNQQEQSCEDKSKVLLPSDVVSEEVEKANGDASKSLAAGYETDSGKKTGGGALREEDLDKKEKVLTYDAKAREALKIKKKKRKQKKDGEFTKSEFIEFLQDEVNYTQKMAEVLADLIFKARTPGAKDVKKRKKRRGGITPSDFDRAEAGDREAQKKIRRFARNMPKV